MDVGEVALIFTTVHIKVLKGSRHRILTGSLEKMGPSVTRFTMKELLLCSTRKSKVPIVRSTSRYSFIKSTNADKEPLKVVGHLEDFVGRSRGLYRCRWP